MFYISSQGHSATGWLAKVLSMHPKIVCWHGTRSIPPFPAGVKDMYVEDFINGLMQCEKASMEEKIFGACHGFYGIKAKDCVERKSGTFLAILRHPVMRVNSIFYPNAVRIIENDEGKMTDNGLIYDFLIEAETTLNRLFIDVVNEKTIRREKRKHLRTTKKRFKNKLKKYGYLKSYNQIKANVKTNSIYRLIMKNNDEFVNKLSNLNKKKSIKPNKYEYFKDLCKSFIGACARTFNTDSVVYNACAYNQIVKMEDMTVSPAYFNEAILQSVLKESADEEYLARVFLVKDHVNIHSRIKLKPLEIYSKWPKAFQNYFDEKLENSSAKRMYKYFDYDIPNSGTLC